MWKKKEKQQTLANGKISIKAKKKKLLQTALQNFSLHYYGLKAVQLVLCFVNSGNKHQASQIAKLKWKKTTFWNKIKLNFKKEFNQAPHICFFNEQFHEGLQSADVAQRSTFHQQCLHESFAKDFYHKPEAL